jgi:hypothetical protein
MRRGRGGDTVWHIVNAIPTRLVGGQNKFPSNPTPFETYGRNVTVCPANIYNKQRNSSKVNNFGRIISANCCQRWKLFILKFQIIYACK